jgi:hypothetical protein
MMMSASSPARLVSIDFWRGMALVIIFVDHIPGNIFSRVTPRNFGFSDAAEIFVFLAGVAAAFAYLRRFVVGERALSTLRVGLRAVKLYTSHIVMLVLCGGIIAYVSLRTQDPRILEMMQFDEVVKDPLASILGIATLGFQPSGLNILPLYIVLLIIAPVLFVLIRLDPRVALAASGAFYLATQLFGLAPPSYPYPDTWFFNPFAWQFLFTLGLCTGKFISDGGFKRQAPGVEKALIGACVAYLALSAVLVHGGFIGTYDLSPLPRFAWDQDKTNIALPRILHFVALAYLVSRLPLEAWIRRGALCQPFIWMGRHSLPVFSLGVVLAMTIELGRILVEGNIGFDICLISFGLALQIGLAWVLEWQRVGAAAKTGLSAARAVALPSS